MPPKKLKSRKKKQKTTEASTSGTPQIELLSNEAYAKERREKLETMTFMNHQYLDWEILQVYGMKEKIQEMVEDKTWFQLFEINEPTYRDVTIEFLSTVTIKEKDGTRSMEFQAFEEVHEIELSQIEFFLGFYDDDEEAEALPTSWPDEMNAETFWYQLIEPKREDFVPSKSLSTSFAVVEHKLLHHILAHTICCKKTSHSKVTNFDMFYLYSMISGYKIDLGVEVANFIDRQVNDTRTRVIFCGGYITALLKGMLIFQLPEGDEGIRCKKISSAPFRGWGLSKVKNRIEPGGVAGEEIQENPPTQRASTSNPPPTDNTYEQLRANISEIKKDVKKERKKNKKERKKNKKFRTTLFNAFKSVISYLNPAAAEGLHYETSSEGSSSTEPES